MDIVSRFRRIAFVEVRPDTRRLTESEASALKHCIRAADRLTAIALDQNWSGNRALREALEARTDDEGRDLYRYFLMSGGPWDRFSHDEPFIDGVGARPRGGGFYPEDLTTAEWQAGLGQSPAAARALRSPHTVIGRGPTGLVATPYSEAYRDSLALAAQDLDGAATALGGGAMADLLRLRGRALLDDDYWESDLLWIDTPARPFEVTIGPYEVYADELFGIKTMFGAYIGLPEDKETEELAELATVVQDIDADLAERFGYDRRGIATPVGVVADVFRTGDAAFGRPFVAYNLPNDPKIHERKGSKKVFSKTLLEAKFHHLAEPIARRRMRSSLCDIYKLRNRILFVFAHELAHGIGPGDSEGVLRELQSPIEEAKADALGIYVLSQLAAAGRLTRDELAGAVVGMVMDSVVEWRTSYKEAHAVAALLEFNWLRSRGAVRYDSSQGVLDISLDRAIDETCSLAWALLELECSPDYNEAQKFLSAWATVPKEAPQMIAGLDDLPLTVYPVYKLDGLGPEFAKDHEYNDELIRPR